MAREEEDRYTALMFNLVRQVTARQDLDDVLGETFRCLRAMIQFTGGSIQLLDDEGWIQMAASDPVAPEHVMNARVPLGTSVAGRVILTEQPVYLPDLELTQLNNSNGGKRVSTGVRSYFAVPLVVDGRAIGVIQIDSTIADAWSEQQRTVFLSIAPVVAAAIQNARANARAASARTRAETAESKLAAARGLIDLARAAARDADHPDVERHLLALERLLRSVPAAEAAAQALLLPQQRVTAG
jgi:transcriptional regulator with GAF, ATPase, and Fis domain